MAITDKQIVDTIIKLSGNGYPPTIREIQIQLGYRSTASVYERLAKLRKAGILAWEPTMVRTLRVVKNPYN